MIFYGIQKSLEVEFKNLKILILYKKEGSHKEKCQIFKFPFLYTGKVAKLVKCGRLKISSFGFVGSNPTLALRGGERGS